METKTELIVEKDEAKKIQMSGSHAVIQSLLKEGVNLVFGYPGGAIMPVYDALYDYHDRLHHVLVRHEQGAVHAAQGFARVTGKVGVAIVTSGPGATNTITGIADAMIDSTPMVVISGQVGSPLLGTDAFQETDVIGISQPVTKWSCQVKKAEEIPAAIAKAFYIARSGRPGPVLVDITKDAQANMMEFDYVPVTQVRSYQPVPTPDSDKIAEAARLINLSKKPLALVGQGVMLGGAEKELLKFLEKSGVPAAWTLLGMSVMPSDHPLNVGMLGMHGNVGPNVKTNEADLIISFGMRFDDRVTGNTKAYAVNAKVIHFDIDPAEINKIIYADVPVLGDIKETLPMLTHMVSNNTHETWVKEFRACDKIETQKIIQPELYPTKEGITMGEVIRRVSEAMNHDAILVTDVGQHQMMASRYFKFRQSRSVVTSGGLGTMGFGLPAAIGAKMGRPDRQVVLFVGDGGFQMTIQELGTIFQTKIPVKIVLLNNNFLGMVRQWQELFFDKRYASTELINPDFQLISKGYGIMSEKVTSRDQLDEAILKLVNSEDAFLLEVVVEKEGNVFPMVPAGASVSDIRLE
ncbi:acetolactate synthase large subunit [Breznakibacter xylanolyticus]|uniref:Acetolactate synthase n=1 Tax=Breznakibacter xylanolyticus TaxID=990 RepID=A0A2W7NIS0_9BACT|nr:biosynthetic-type acetolactate synthase large subunit [Breznakibacter xylanolyticus]PZX19373.1 acetolactate synthase large subunit [Breznakibacter xylanolyticus]